MKMSHVPIHRVLHADRQPSRAQDVVLERDDMFLARVGDGTRGRGREGALFVRAHVEGIPRSFIGAVGMRARRARMMAQPLEKRGQGRQVGADDTQAQLNLGPHDDVGDSDEPRWPTGVRVRQDADGFP